MSITIIDETKSDHQHDVIADRMGTQLCAYCSEHDRYCMVYIGKCRVCEKQLIVHKHYLSSDDGSKLYEVVIEEA